MAPERASRGEGEAVKGLEGSWGDGAKLDGGGELASVKDARSWALADHRRAGDFDRPRPQVWRPGGARDEPGLHRVGERVPDL